MPDHPRTRRRAARAGGAGSDDRDGYRAVVEDLTETVCRFRADGTLTFVNDVYCRTFGKSRRALVGRKWQPRAVAADVPMIEARLATLSPANPVVVIENRVHDAKGDVRWMQFVNRALYDGSGRLTEIQSVGRDITELKRAEANLRESEQRFTTLFRASPVPTTLTRMKDGVLQDVNDAFLRQIGRTREEVVGHAAAEIDLWVEPTRRADLVRRLRAGETVSGFAGKYRRRSGETGTVLISAARVDLAGESFILALGLDHTARERAEAALQRSQTLLRQAIESAPDAVFAIDREYRLLVNNQRHQRALVETGGHPLEVGESVLTVDYTAEARARWRAAYDRALRGAEFRLETRWTSVQGAPRAFENTFSPLRDAAGAILGVLVVSRDVTDRERRQAAILRTAMDGFGLVDRQGRIKVVNSALCRMTGYSEAELLELTIGDLNAVESPAETAARLRRVRRRGADRFESRLRRKDGSAFDVEVSVQVHPDDRGGLVAFLRDVTDRRQAEQQMQVFPREVILARERERKEISSALHHDVGSLAVGIQSRLDVLEKNLRSGQSREALEWLGRVRQALEEAVDRLKNVASAVRPPELDTIGLRAALRQHCARVAEHQGVRVRVTETLGRRRVLGEAAATLFRIAQEALTNALRHGQAGRVDVKLAARGGRVTLRIRDDGRGFDPAKPREPDAPRIGLVSMREMATAVGGACAVESRPGKGTTVRAWLPLGPVRAAGTRARKERAT